MQVGLVKDVHELCQFSIMKLASCTSHLDSLDSAMQNYHTEAAKTSANLEALEKCVAVTEDILVSTRLREVKADLQKMHEEIATTSENWDPAIIKLQGLDSEVENVRAQIQATSQELIT